MFKFLAVISGVLLSQLSFAAACPASTSTTTAGNGNCTITGAQSTIQLNFNSGFDDATTIAAVGGNLGTTVGAQRKLSFIKAGEIIADQVNSSQTLIVDADFAGLSCTTNSAVLGSAGATTNTGNVTPAAGVINTFYPIGLINALGNTDYQAGLSDVTAQFNSNIGNAGCLQSSNGWYYGYDAPPSNYIGFTTVLLHEVTHGLGFASLVDASTGAKPSNLDDIFSNNLYSKLNSTKWSNAAGLSNAQRAASAISGDGLLWDASNVNTQAIGLLTAGYQDNDSSSSFTSGDRVQMYAPNPLESGSSVSHFDTAAAPNELMEPQYTAGQMDLGLALYLLKDIGWSVTPVVAPANNAPVITGLPNPPVEDTKLINLDLGAYASDADGDTLSYSYTACGLNLTCTMNGSTIKIEANGGVGTTPSVTVQVDDGTDQDTFTFLVSIIAATSPSTTVNAGGGEVSDGDTLTIGFDTSQININNGHGTYTYTLVLDGNNVDNLITLNGSTITLGLPADGAFAGEYTLTVKDELDGDVITVTVIRPLNLTWSATSILGTDNSQTLRIEGGAAGEQYLISQNPSADFNFKDALNAAVDHSNSITVISDPANYNAATLYITPTDVGTTTSLDVTVETVGATYDDVTTSLQIYPAIQHAFTVVDTSGDAINNAKLSLNGGESILSNMNLEADYYSNASGLVTIELPDTGDSLALTTTASGYTADNLSVDNGITTHTITLTEMANGVTVTGAISAMGTQDFTAHPPTVLISYSDGSSDIVPVTISSVSQANFTHSVDINLKSMSSMEVKQEDSLNINVGMSNVQQNQNYNILLERHVAVVSVGSGGGGGSLPWYSLLLLPLLMRFKRVRK